MTERTGCRHRRRHVALATTARAAAGHRPAPIELRTETVPTTPVMRTTFAVLAQMVRAKHFDGPGEHTVDPDAGVFL